MTTAIIVDDEIHLADYLADKLSTLWPELDILGHAQNGADALNLVAQSQPDIAFLDIHMPGMNGMQLAEALPDNTHVVFVTAFDEYAVDAFQRAAVDYLLKPVTDDRLQQTIERLKLMNAKATPSGSKKDGMREQISELLQELTQSKPTYLQWLRTGLEETTRLVAVDEVIYFQADQKYTSVMTIDAEHLIRRSIKDLEQELDPNQFWRIHRGIIVRVDQIVSATRDLRGRYTIKLADRKEQLRSSQTYGHLFRQM